MKVTKSAADIPNELKLGRWVVWSHAWAERGGITPDEWRARVQAACEEQGVTCVIKVLPRPDITVVWNAAKTPPFEEVQQSIDQVLNMQWRQVD
jgi:hypothetical protein